MVGPGVDRRVVMASSEAHVAKWARAWARWAIEHPALAAVVAASDALNRFAAGDFVGAQAATIEAASLAARAGESPYTRRPDDLWYVLGKVTEEDGRDDLAT